MENPYLIIRNFKDKSVKSRLEEVLEKMPLKILDRNKNVPLILIVPSQKPARVYYYTIPFRTEDCEVLSLEKEDYPRLEINDKNILYSYGKGARRTNYYFNVAPLAENILPLLNNEEYERIARKYNKYKSIGQPKRPRGRPKYFKRKPEMDELIERGDLQREIGRQFKITGKAVRQYINRSEQYAVWKDNRKKNQ